MKTVSLPFIIYLQYSSLKMIFFQEVPIIPIFILLDNKRKIKAPNLYWLGCNFSKNNTENFLNQHSYVKTVFIPISWLLESHAIDRHCPDCKLSLYLTKMPRPKSYDQKNKARGEQVTQVLQIWELHSIDNIQKINETLSSKYLEISEQNRWGQEGIWLKSCAERTHNMGEDKRNL